MKPAFSLKIFHLLIFLAMLMFLSACTHTFQIPVDLYKDRKEENKIPLRVGLWMPTDFLSYTYTKKVPMGMGDKFVFPLGEVFSKMSERMVETAFQETVTLSSLDDAIAKNIKVVIFPQIQMIDIAAPPRAWAYYRTMVIIKWTAVAPTGRIIWVNTFKGEGEVKVSYSHRKRNVCKCMQLAVEDHFSKALDGIVSSTWWQSIE